MSSQKQIQIGFMHHTHTSGSHQVVDFFTKPLPISTFSYLLSKLGTISTAPTLEWVLNYIF